MPQNYIKSTAGPLCNSVDDVVAYFKMLWSSNTFDRNFSIPNVPFNQLTYQFIVINPSEIYQNLFHYNTNQAHLTFSNYLRGFQNI
jgi:hypothetical protein